MNNLIKAFGYAFNGIFFSFRKERNLKWHSLASILVIAGGFIFHIPYTEWMVIILSIGIVVTAEMLNTSIELLCNKITRERQADIRIIKDISAGGVLVSALAAGICGLIIFVPKIVQFINQPN